MAARRGRRPEGNGGWTIGKRNNQGKARFTAGIPPFFAATDKKTRRIPVVSEICVQYVFDPRINVKLVKHWLLGERKRTGLPLQGANKACGVVDAAERKCQDQRHFWYWMPPEKFQMMADFANEHGRLEGRP